MPEKLESYLSRPVWMRPTSWRWMSVLELRAGEGRPGFRVPVDASLHESALFYRHLCEQPERFSIRNRRFPEMSLAYQMFGESTGDSQWRGLLDSLLLTDMDPADFSGCLNLDIPADTVRLYHDCFFDVRSYLTSDPAIHINVLSAAEQDLSRRAMKNMERNCMLRLFAYHWGADALLEYYFSRGTGQRRAQQRWFRSLAAELVTAQAAEIAMNRRSLQKEECIEVFKLAQSNWKLPEDTLASAEEEMRQKFLHDTVQILDRNLKQAEELRMHRDISREQALREVTFV